MSELLDLIANAWRERVGQLCDPSTSSGQAELARRLARRRSGMMRRPPRAWCLAVRASDQRINPATAACVPEKAAYPRKAPGHTHEIYDEHEVTLTARLVRRLVKPVFVPAPGLDQELLAKMLGCDRCNLTRAIERGVFRVHHVRGLGGKHGPAVPVLYTEKPIDASRQLWAHADVLWGTTWKWLSEHVPDDLEQTLVRVPVIVNFPFEPRRRRGEASEEIGPYVRGPEGPQFRGWRWVCPGCHKTCRTVFYPLPPMRIVRLLPREFHDSDEGHPDAWPAPMRTFACARCHNVLYFTRFNGEKWNHLIAHLSGGLLYGHEVPKPEWYLESRTRAFRPRVNCEPSRRRQQVLDGLLDGLSYRQLALKLGVSKSTVNTHARELYRQHGVKGPAALREKLGASNLKLEDAGDKQHSTEEGREAETVARAA